MSLFYFYSLIGSKVNCFCYAHSRVDLMVDAPALLGFLSFCRLDFLFHAKLDGFGQ